MALYRRKPTETCRAGHPYTEENTIWIKSSRTWTGRTRNCRICRVAKLARRPKDQLAAKMRRWRATHRELVNQRGRDATRRRREFFESKKAGGCVRCGETTMCCLDFHHRDPHVKEGNISAAGYRNRSLEWLEREIAKCDVLCANCHRKLHWEERNVREGE